MKMSDKFQLPVDCFVSTIKLNTECSLSFLNVESVSGKDHNKHSDCEFIGHAINNYDGLLEENAKLRDVVEAMIEQFDYDGCTEYEFKLLKEAKQLLNQLKEQNNDK